MTNTELKALQDSNLATNASNDITAAKLRAVTTEFVKHSGGFVYYENSSTTPQVVDVSEQDTVALTNDGASADTVTAYKPYYATNALFANNAIQLAQIPNGSVVTFRFCLDVIDSDLTTEISIKASLKDSEGVEVISSSFIDSAFRESGEHKLTDTCMFFMDSNIEGGTVDFSITATDDCEVIWRSIMIDIR
jgi:hypothetical protein